MKEMQKPNDMFVATLSKNDADIFDFVKSGLTTDNTQLLDRNQYKELKFIQNTFSKNGVFDDAAFDAVYDKAMANNLELMDLDLSSNLTELLEYNSSSFKKPEGAKIRKTGFTPTKFINPGGEYIGISDVEKWSGNDKTAKELAQQGGIWDPVNQKWLEGTAESRNFFDKAFGTPLIYAKYTKDGLQENPITKQVDYHQAGEFITDENGNYFTQLSNGENLTDGVETVKLSDILSHEDSWINKIDFFDSDDKDKSIAGTAAKVIVGTLPYFIPYVGTAYTAAQILIGLGSSLPYIAKSMNGIINNEKYSQFDHTANQIINYFDRYNTGVTEHGSSSFWTLESLGNQAIDIIGQLYSQRGMASMSKFLVKMPKAKNAGNWALELEQQRKMANKAKSLSLGYMALTQAADTYNDAIQGGYDPRTAGLATLATTAALFGIMKFDEGPNGLGTWFLDKTTGYDREVLRSPIGRGIKAAREEYMKNIQKDLEKGSVQSSKAAKGLLKFWDHFDNMWRFGAEGVWKAMIAEGVEEVTEEAIQDSIKGIFDGLNSMGFTFAGKQNASFGGWDNVFSKEGLERYLETFVGGALGGGLFEVTNYKMKPFFDKLWRGDVTEPGPKRQFEMDIWEACLQGRADEAIKEIDKAVRFVPNTKLTIDKDGKVTLNKADGVTMTERELIRNRLIAEVKITNERCKELMAGADFSIIPEEFRQHVRAVYGEQIKKNLDPSGNLGNYVRKRFFKASEEVFQLQNEIEQLQEKEALTDEQREQLTEKKELLKKKIDYVQHFFSGEADLDTFTDLHFLTDDSFRRFFINAMTIEEFYKNVIQEKGMVEFDKLPDDGKGMTKKEVEHLYNLFNKQTSNLDDLVEQCAVFRKAITAITDRVAPDLDDGMSDLRRQSAVLKAIKKMQIQFEQRKEAINQMMLEDILREENPNWDGLSDEVKQKKIQEATKSQVEQLIKDYSVENLIELIQADPTAFSNCERWDMDYYEVLKNAGIIVDPEGLNSEQLKIFKNLVNAEFAITPLNKYNVKSLGLIFDNINQKLSDKGNIFVQAIKHKADAKKEGTALIDINDVLQLTTSEDWESKVTEDIQMMKMKDIKKYIVGEEWKAEDILDIITRNGNIQLKALVNKILSDPKLLNAILTQDIIPVIKNKLRDVGITGDKPYENPDFDDSVIDLAFKNYYSKELIEGIKNTIKNSGVRKLKDYLGKGDPAKEIITKWLNDIISDKDGVSTLSIVNYYNLFQKYLDVPDTDDGKIMILSVKEELRKLSESNFQETPETNKVANYLKNALQKIWFSLGKKDGGDIISFLNRLFEEVLNNNENPETIDLGDLNEKIKRADGKETTLLNDALELLNVVQCVFNLMAPGAKTEDGKYLDGVNQRRKNLARSMGLDDSNIRTISAEEYEAMDAVIQQVRDRLFTLTHIQKNISENAYKKFEEIREEIIGKQFNLLRAHANPPDDDDEKEIKEKLFGTSFKFDTEDQTLESVQRQILQYKQSLQDYWKKMLQDDSFIAWLDGRFNEDRMNMKEEEWKSISSEQKLIAVLVDYFNDNNSIFYEQDNELQTISVPIEGDVKELTFQKQYFLGTLVGLIGSEKSYKEIQTTVQAKFQESGLYPREDQISAAVMTMMGISAKNSYDFYLDQLEKLYNKEDASGDFIGAVKQHIKGLIQLEGPAGSGKSALYQIIINSAKQLGLANKIAVTALQQHKVNNLKEDVKSVTGLEDSNFLTIDSLIPGAKEFRDQYNKAVHDMISILKLKSEYAGAEDDEEKSELAEKIKDIDKEVDDFTITEADYTRTIDVGGIKCKVTLEFTENATDFTNFGQINYKIEFEDSSKVQLSDKDINFILLDESTTLSPMDWALLNALNINIFATGHGMQKSYEVTYTETDGKEEAQVLGNENVLGFTLPTLISVHRAANSGVAKNEAFLRTVGELALATTTKDSHQGLRDYTISRETHKAVVKELAKSKLIFTLNDRKNGFLGAFLNKDSKKINNALSQIKDKSKSILGIVSNDKDAAELNELLKGLGFTNITILNEDEVQGAEADYVITYKLQNRYGNRHYTTYKSAYTYITRARLGFIGFEPSDNGLFESIGIRCTESDSIHEIVKGKIEGSLGESYLNSWKENCDAMVVSSPTSTPASSDSEKKSVLTPSEVEEDTDALLDEKEEPIDEPEDSVEEDPEKEEGLTEEKKKAWREKNETFQDIFEGHAMPLYNYGYILGISKEDAKKLNSQSAIDIDKTLEKYPNSPLNIFWQLLKQASAKSDLEINRSKIFKDDSAKVKEILGTIIKRADIEGNIIAQYVAFINGLRNAVQEGQLTHLSVTNRANDENSHLYLKPNDNEDLAGERQKTVGLPLIDDTGNLKGFIPFSVIGYTEFTEKDDDISEGIRAKIHQILSSEEDASIILRQKNDLDTKKKHNASLTSGKYNFKRKTSGFVNPYQAMQHYVLKPDIGNNQVLFDISGMDYQRISTTNLNKLGFEIVSEERFECSKHSSNFDSFISDFREWYNKYRWNDISEEDFKKKFGFFFKRAADFILIKPLGGSDADAFPVLVKGSCTWNELIDSQSNYSKNSDGNPNNLLGTPTKTMLEAILTIRGVEIKYSDLNFIKKGPSLELDYEKIINRYKAVLELDNHDSIETLLKHLITLNITRLAIDSSGSYIEDEAKRKCNLLQTELNKVEELKEKAEDWTGDKLDSYKLKYGKVKSELGDSIISELKGNMENWAYKYGGTNQFIERIFEPPRTIMDLRGFEDASESSSSGTITPISEGNTNPKFADEDGSTVKNLLKVFKDNNFLQGLKNNMGTRNILLDNIRKIIENMGNNNDSAYDITQNSAKTLNILLKSVIESAGLSKQLGPIQGDFEEKITICK